MKWYRPIPCDNTVKNPLVCSETNLITYQLKEEHFLSGEKIMNWNDDGHDIIRLKEYPLEFFVSEKFKRMFVANRFTGYSFSSVELN